MAFWLAITVGAAVADPGCEAWDERERPTVSHLAEEASRAVGDLTAGDDKGFRVGAAIVEAGLVCAEARLRPYDAVELHLLYGVRAHELGKSERAAGHFRGAAESDPMPLTVARSFVLDPQLSEAWRAAALGGGEAWVALPESSGGQVYVDGMPADSYPSDRPWFFQYKARSGELLPPTLMEAGDAPPAYPRLRVRLARITGLSAGGAVVSYAVAGVFHGLITAQWRKAYSDPTYEAPDSTWQMRANQASVLSGVALTSVAVTSGIRLLRTLR